MKQAQKFAQVVVPAPLKEPLLYSIPQPLESQIQPGTRVLIPLQKRTVTGVVMQITAENPLVQTKPIVAALDDRPIFDRHLLELGRWVSHYYLASLGEVIATMLPSKSRRQSQKIAILKNPESSIVNELGRRVLRELRQQNGKMAIKTLTA